MFRIFRQQFLKLGSCNLLGPRSLSLTSRAQSKNSAALRPVVLWLFRLLAISLGLAMAFGMAEVAIRIMIPASTAHLFLLDPVSGRHRIMRPNVRAVVYGVPIETNASGFRATREYSADKPADTIRIVAVGDSFAVSAGVPIEAPMTTLLEGLLDEADPHHRVEVYNVAVGGHGILHHVATMKEVALKYDPDLVLLLLYPFNDLDVGVFDAEVERQKRIAGATEPAPWQAQSQGVLESKALTVVFSKVQDLARQMEFVNRHAPPPAGSIPGSTIMRWEPNDETEISPLFAKFEPWPPKPTSPSRPSCTR